MGDSAIRTDLSKQIQQSMMKAVRFMELRRYMLIKTFVIIANYIAYGPKRSKTIYGFTHPKKINEKGIIRILSNSDTDKRSHLFKFCNKKYCIRAVFELYFRKVMMNKISQTAADSLSTPPFGWPTWKRRPADGFLP